jgi:hypothetical protein
LILFETCCGSRHHWWELTLGGRLLIGPAVDERLDRVLDVGAGTGIWAIDFGMWCKLLEFGNERQDLTARQWRSTPKQEYISHKLFEVR